ncbi:MAG: GTPase ObgE, partial [Gemmatimonadales bacterium]|nr:GTPase ObgE [Gemmatimonadales bacterium]
PTRQTPREWEPGEWGEERHIELELKLIADVGLVGEPNAGKSTLLARVTAAKPRIADYPFSTLTPNLGVVGLSGHRSFVMADIPGIIEGAHEGRGLGTQFLRHIERTRTLALLVPLDDEDPQATYDLLREELRAHDAALAGISHCVLLTKADLNPAAAEPPVSVAAPGSWGQFTISAVTGAGLDRALEGLWTRVQREKEAAAEEAEADPFGSSEAWRP